MTWVESMARCFHLPGICPWVSGLTCLSVDFIVFTVGHAWEHVVSTIPFVPKNYL